MDRNVDREKVRRIFQEVTSDESITPGEFEEMISNLSGDELLMLRELLVNARCSGIKTLAERGWPGMRGKPN
ncbi:MAG TPA: hypothetical protein VEU62_16975 [Bryobacterales bacterium]|nr:hypothetical protein [Bryobacterales bacterium]